MVSLLSITHMPKLEKSTGLQKLAPLLALLLPFVITISIVIASKINQVPHTRYRPGDVYSVKAGAVFSKFYPSLPYQRFKFPFRPGFRGVYQTFLDKLAHMHTLGDTGFGSAQWNLDGETICLTQTNGTNMVYDDVDLEWFVSAIKAGYKMDLFFAHLPVISKVDGKFSHGIPLGAYDGGLLYLYNHHDFEVEVDGLGRLVQVRADYRHTSYACGPVSFESNNRDRRVTWSFTVRTIISDRSADDTDTIYRNDVQGEAYHVDLALIAITFCVTVVALVLVGLFVYRIYRKNDYGIKHYRPLLRTLATGQASPNAHYMWRQFEKIILGAPNHPRLFVGCVSSGAQITVTVVLATIATLFYQQSWNNPFNAIVCILLPATGSIAGYVAASLHQQFALMNKVRFLSTLPLYQAVPLNFLFFVMTSMQMLDRTPASYLVLIALIGLLILINCVCFAVGAALVTRRLQSRKPQPYIPPPSHLCQTISVQCGTLFFACLVQAGGAVWIGRLLANTSWGTSYRQKWWFILVFVTLWLIGVGMIGIVVTHFNVIRYGIPQWHWPTYMLGLGCGVCVFITVTIMTFETMTQIDPWIASLLFIYLGLGSVYVCIVVGGVAWLSTNLYLRTCIYRNEHRHLTSSESCSTSSTRSDNAIAMDWGISGDTTESWSEAT